MIRDIGERAWAAGFADGEGCFYVSKNITSRTRAATKPGFAAAQVDRQVLDRFCAIIGVGKVYGPYGPYKGSRKNSRPQYRYSVEGFEKVEAIGVALWPWLSAVKRDQCERAVREAQAGPMPKTSRFSD